MNAAIKLTIRHLTGLCFVLALVHGFILAQGMKTAPPATQSTGSLRQTSTSPEQAQAELIRREHLRNLREYVLTRIVDDIKRIKEPALRISARNELLKSLTPDKSSSDVDKALTAKIAADNLADFKEHGEEIMPSLAEYLFGYLGAWIKEYEPSLREKFEAVDNSIMGGTASRSISALWELPGGDSLAAQRIAQDLDAGQNIPGLELYLYELADHQSQAIAPLLSKLLDMAAGGGLSFETLTGISYLYLQSQMPLALKQRFVRVVIARTFSLNNSEDAQNAYYLLTNMMPVIQQLTPELYNQALNQRLALAASRNEWQIAAEERSKRLDESSSAVEDIVAEADEAKTPYRRNELLAEALQLALEKKRFDLCLNILPKLDLDARNGLPAWSWSGWNDQFVREFVQAVLAAKKPEMAEKGAGFAVAPLAKVDALMMVMRYWEKALDKSAAQRLLEKAAQAAGDAQDNTEKAKAFLLLSLAANQADGSQKVELLDSAIKALNNVSLPDRDADKKSYQQSIWKLNGVENQLSATFKDVIKRDENGALTLVESIVQPGSRTFALIGVLQGIRELSLSRKV